MSDFMQWLQGELQLAVQIGIWLTIGYFLGYLVGLQKKESCND
jgi:hypothetical protein